MNRSTLQVLAATYYGAALPVFWKLLAGVNSAYVLAQRIVFFPACSAPPPSCSGSGARRWAILRDKKQRGRYLLCGMLITVNWGVYIPDGGLRTDTGGQPAYYMNPLFSVVIGAMVFKERLSVLQWCPWDWRPHRVGYSVAVYGGVPYLAVIVRLSFALYGALKKGSSRGEVSICMETLSVFAAGGAFYPLRAVFRPYHLRVPLRRGDGAAGPQQGS